MGDFLLLENFSISSQSPRVAKALIFSHQYLGTAGEWLLQLPARCSPQLNTHVGHQEKPPLPTAVTHGSSPALPSFQTHRLSGILKSRYSCSAFLWWPSWIRVETVLCRERSR